MCNPLNGKAREPTRRRQFGRLNALHEKNNRPLLDGGSNIFSSNQGSLHNKDINGATINRY